MRGRTAALIAATAALTTGGVVASATAAQGPPPPPVGAKGVKVKQFATGLFTPTSFAFGGGNVFEGDGGQESSQVPNGGVFRLKGGAATKLAGSPNFVGGLVWHKGTLYVSGASAGATGIKFQLQAWSGWTGTKFNKQKVIYTAPKGFQGFNGLAFGPDGRLYVGVDVGLLNQNDHGPASTSPFLYDILSLKPNGKDVKVFAKGIRQPWQFAFEKGSSDPFVSDLGQDSGNVKNPPDFLLKVHKGDNYGFPKCTQTDAKKCKGFAKPFKEFAPHTDIMGLAIIGKTLYMTSFIGNKGKFGEVLSMPLKGGKVKTVVKGQIAPFVGLGTSGGSLYVGELTGRVFKVTP
ncbi:MAG: PQQ-dependent sugar dehydrogenase [Solirubrobacteraceae bacterium]